MLSFHSRVRHRIAGAAFGAGLLASLAYLAQRAWCWETAHGPPDNTGFVDVVTKPAEYAIKTVGDIGTIAPGAGPVVAPDGTVYLANEQGKLMSFKPDGTPGWSRTIAAGQRIVASPAIGSDGSVYVIGVSVSRDHRGGKTVNRVDSALHVFNSTGGYLGQTVFPDHNGGGGTTASPNLWRFNGTELVIVPAVYRREVGAGIDIRLLAFSSGALVLDQRATTIIPEIVTTDEPSPLCWVPILGTGVCLLMDATGFPASDGRQSRDASVPPFPPVGIFTNPLGGTPFILVSDHFQDLVGFTLSGGAFLESFRVHDGNRFMRSAPAILPDLHAIIGTEDLDSDTLHGHRRRRRGVLRTQHEQAGAGHRPASDLGHADAPGRWADSIDRADSNGRARWPQRRQEIAPWQVTRTRLRPHRARTCSSPQTDAIQTFDPASLTELSRMPWIRGGAVAARDQSDWLRLCGRRQHALYVFPPSLKQLPPNRVLPQTGATVVSTDTANQDSKPYKPPLTMSGNRLFACEELDGDDCGKGDYQTIATAFCKKEGFIGAGQIKVDSEEGEGRDARRTLLLQEQVQGVRADHLREQLEKSADRRRHRDHDDNPWGHDIVEADNASERLLDRTSDTLLRGDCHCARVRQRGRCLGIRPWRPRQ